MNIHRLAQLFNQHKAMALFENGKAQEAFWDNEHISKMMLMAHLNPNWDAASRKPETIDATVHWIKEQLKYQPGDRLLDLGCGPGLYATRFYDQGLEVVGVDYSQRSIAYAKEQAAKERFNIEYLYMNYLDLAYSASFDIATLIYCDFGVLSPADRGTLLKRIHQALKPGGHFVFDVWTTGNPELTAVYKNWFIHEVQGFWKPTPHLELVNKQFYQDELVSLKQHIIIEEESIVSVYQLWEQCYTITSITDLLNQYGFEVMSVTGDLTGLPFEEGSKLIGIIARKV